VEARARRAAAAVGLAAVLVASIGVLYLRPWQAFAPTPAARPSPRPTAQLVDAENGWSILLRETPPGSVESAPTGLARSRDGGRHWTLVAAPR
jgi:hypothetical protein